MTEDKVVGWHHSLEGHEFEQALGVGDEQGSLACCSPWDYKESDLSDWTEPVLGAPSSARGRLCPPPASLCCAAPWPHPLAQPNSYHTDVSPSWPMGNQASL